LDWQASKGRRKQFKESFLEKFKIHLINGQDYLATRTVTLKGKKYQEFHSADIMRPDIIYFENTGKKQELVDDWNIYYALRKKYAICEKSLHGELIINWYATRCDKSLSQEEVSKKLYELFEADVKKFSENGAKVLGHILIKRGIGNPQKWLEEKMREGFTGPGESPYFLDSSIDAEACCGGDGTVKFRTLKNADNERTRAHEISHKIGQNNRDDGQPIKRSGLLILGSKKVKDKKTGETYIIYCEHGRALNEGVTDLLAEKLGKKRFRGTPYFLERLVARTITKLVGEDIVFEATLFGPQLLADRLNERTKSEHLYIRIVSSLDFYYEATTKINKAILKLGHYLKHCAKLIFSTKHRRKQQDLNKARMRMSRGPSYSYHRESITSNRQSIRQLPHAMNADRQQEYVKQATRNPENGL